MDAVCSEVDHKKVLPPVAVSTLDFPEQITVSPVTCTLGIKFTVTTWLQSAVLPDPSVTVQITVVFPKGKAEGALLFVEATLQLSLVTGVPKDTPVAVQPLLVRVVMSAGHVITGFTLSFTVTTWLHIEEFPAPSVTVHMTVVLPDGNVDGALLL